MKTSKKISVTALKACQANAVIARMARAAVDKERGQEMIVSGYIPTRQVAEPLGLLIDGGGFSGDLSRRLKDALVPYLAYGRGTQRCWRMYWHKPEAEEFVRVELLRQKTEPQPPKPKPVPLPKPPVSLPDDKTHVLKHVLNSLCAIETLLTLMAQRLDRLAESTGRLEDAWGTSPFDKKFDFPDLVVHLPAACGPEKGGTDAQG